MLHERKYDLVRNLWNTEWRRISFPNGGFAEINSDVISRREMQMT
jgi:hypothetical protein